ncbi:unnamed protein product [Caenorhabditis angaria]|uniref:Uncharacterized protein n=1 Tax=Caenorhabditis angaria TaxID=860376 RepID=A0A9P1IFK2_9PELO|nr:unnamed protein product [Caenorhabditis angaria]
MTDEDKNEKDAGISEPTGSSEVAAIQELLAECGVEEYDSRVVGMLMDVQFSMTSKILELASGLARHNQKQVIDSDEIHAVNDILGILKEVAPDHREKMLQTSIEKNEHALPQIRHNYGLKLPNDRFCQLAPNLEFRTDDYELMDTSTSNIPHFDPQQLHQQQQQQSQTMLRPDVVQNILKRRAPEDDFDS